MPSVAELSVLLVILVLCLSASEGEIASTSRTDFRCLIKGFSVVMSYSTVLGFMFIGVSSLHKVGKTCFLCVQICPCSEQPFNPIKFAF